ADGRTATFVVDGAESFDQADFPDERAYAATPDAQVRLITRSAPYDHSVEDYTENLRVFAHLGSPGRPAGRTVAPGVSAPVAPRGVPAPPGSRPPGHPGLPRT